MYSKIKRLFYGYAFFDDFVLIYPLYSVMFADRGLSPAQISSLLVVWSLTSLLLEVPSGSLADKYPRRRVLLCAAFIQVASLGCWTLIPNYFGFMLGFILWGVKSALESGTTEALVYDELKKYDKTSDYAKVTGKMESFRLTAMILGALGASILAGSGYTLLLILSIVAILLSALAVYLLPQAKPVESTGETKYFDYLREGTKLVLGSRKILTIIIFAAIIFGLSSVDEYYSLFFDEQGFSNTKIAILIAIVCLCEAIGSWLAHKLENKHIPLPLPLLLAGGLLLSATLVPTAFSFIAIGLFGAFVYTIKVLSDTYLQRELVDKTRATATSVLGLGDEIFALIVYGVFAITGETNSYSLGFQAVAAILLMAAVVYGLLGRKYRLS